MLYVGRAPVPPLDRFIERLWYCSDPNADPGGPPRERVLPGGGCVDLVVNLVDDDVRIYEPGDPPAVRARAGALVCGGYTKSFFVEPGQRKAAVGVHFRPGAALPFLGISPAEIVDTHVPLDDVWGSQSRNLRERLVEASSPSERLALVEAVLLRRLERARPGHPAARAAVAALSVKGNAARVADVATAVGLSRRRLVEVFEREVGVTPKLYARLQRFHSVKQQLASRGEPASWAAFALTSGYFDQSHMIRDFVDFAGMTPTGYLESRTGETRLDHLVHAYRPT